MNLATRSCLVLALFAGLFYCGCKTMNDRPFTLSDSQHILRVGVAADYPPVVFMQNKALAGVEADFARSLAKKLGRKLDFVEMTRDKLVDALMQNKIDIIMSGMSVTDERKVRVAFCAPYLKVGQMALMRRSDSAKFSTLPAIIMSNARVGIQKGTTAEQVVQQKFLNARKLIYSTSKDAALDLARHRIDLVIDDAPIIWWLASENDTELTVFPTAFTEEYLAWGVRQGNNELLEAANNILAQWDKDGTLDRVFARWIPYMK
ncbi:MAG: transporter substrate-binding domain-containing protein [Lentisphaerota bacterium]